MKKYKTPESIDMTDFLEGVLKETPQDSIIFIEKSLALINHIFNILEKKEIKQKDLAILLGKSEPEISKWLSGSHNLTLRTIAKIEAVLGETVIEIPNKVKEEFISNTINQPTLIKFIPKHTAEGKDNFKKVNTHYEFLEILDYKKAS